ncbi:hypothetical protein Tco_0700689 [Tanacetum coccineum]
MNPQETQQVAARDEKWVPFTERVKISSTNVRLETTVPQKEETFQVVIDLIKNSSCFKAFTISADVPEIFMQQFWYSIKKVQGTDSYEFLLANKKCVVNADVFRTILDICPRVEGVNFTDVPDDDTTLAFLIKLGYKDVALELGKSISLTEAEEAKAARKVHATHARIMTESILEYTKKKSSGRSYRGVAIQDTPKAANIIQDLKERKKISKRRRGIGGSIEGTGTIPGVPDESTVVSTTSSEGTGTKPGVSDEEKDITKENFILEWVILEILMMKMMKLNLMKDEIYKYKIRVRKDEDEEMLNAEAEDSGKGDAEVSDAAKADAEKTEEAKDDSKKAELPPTSSSLSISSGFGDQFLKLSSDTFLFGTVKDTIDAEINSLLDIKIQYEVPHIQYPSALKVPLRVAKLEKDVSKLKKIDLSAKALAALKTQVPYVVDNYLGSKVGDVFQKELKKHTTDLIQKYSL